MQFTWFDINLEDVCTFAPTLVRARRFSVSPRACFSYTALNQVGSAIYSIIETFLRASCPPTARTQLRALRGSHAPKRNGSVSVKEALNTFFLFWQLAIFFKKECCSWKGSFTLPSPLSPLLQLQLIAISAQPCPIVWRGAIVLLNLVHFSEIGQKCGFEIQTVHKLLNSPPAEKTQNGWARKMMLFVL